MDSRRLHGYLHCRSSHHDKAFWPNRSRYHLFHVSASQVSNGIAQSVYTTSTVITIGAIRTLIAYPLYSPHEACTYLRRPWRTAPAVVWSIDDRWTSRPLQVSFEFWQALNAYTGERYYPSWSRFSSAENYAATMLWGSEPYWYLYMSILMCEHINPVPRVASIGPD